MVKMRRYVLLLLQGAHVDDRWCIVGCAAAVSTLYIRRSVPTRFIRLR